MKAPDNFDALLRFLEVSLTFTYKQVDEKFGVNHAPDMISLMVNYFREKHAVWLEKGGVASEQFYYTILHPITQAFDASLIICVSEHTLSMNVRFKNKFMEELVGRTQICLLANQDLGAYAAPFSAEDVESFKALERLRSKRFKIADNGVSYFSRTIF